MAMRYLSIKKAASIFPPVLSKFFQQTIRCCVSKDIYLGPSPSKSGFDDYELGRKECESIQVPDRFNFARDIFDNWAAKEARGERNNSLPAYWYVHSNGSEIKWSFTELSALSKRAANVLEACKIKKGDILLVTLPKIPEWWILYLACIRIGAIFCTGTSMLTAEDIKYRLDTSKAKCVVCNEDTFAAVSQGVEMVPTKITKLLVCDKSEQRSGWINFNELFHKTSSDKHECVDSCSDEPMTYFFTSGTTGKPKIVEHTHVSYGLAHHITAKYWLDLTENDTILSLSDPGWAKAAWSNFFAPWHSGSCIFIDEVAKFCPERVLTTLQNYPINVFCASPTAYRMMILKDIDKYKFSHLRHCLSAGEPLNPAIFKVWHDKTGLTLREGFGQSETVIQCGMFKCLPIKLGSMGKPAPGFNIQVIDKEGNEVERGAEGEVGIQIKPNRPIGLFAHYSGDKGKTKSAFQGDFYRTGDRAIMDEDGYLWFVGRADDVIISSGYRIGPFEVESVLMEHPAVVEVAVVSSPDDKRGEIVAAYIILREDYENSDEESLVKTLQDFVKEKTAPYKYPRKIVFVKEFPKTVSGKIQRIKLKKKEWEEYFQFS